MNFATPSVVTMTLEGLMSRCTNPPCECMLSPSSNCRKMSYARSTEIRLSVLIISSSDCPSTYSMTIKGCPPCKPEAIHTNDIGVAHRGSGNGIAPEALDYARLSKAIGVQHLEGNNAVQALCLGPSRTMPMPPCPRSARTWKPLGPRIQRLPGNCLRVSAEFMR